MVVKRGESVLWNYAYHIRKLHRLLKKAFVENEPASKKSIAALKAGIVECRHIAHQCIDLNSLVQLVISGEYTVTSLSAHDKKHIQCIKNNQKISAVAGSATVLLGKEADLLLHIESKLPPHHKFKLSYIKPRYYADWRTSVLSLVTYHKLVLDAVLSSLEKRKGPARKELRTTTRLLAAAYAKLLNREHEYIVLRKRKPSKTYRVTAQKLALL